MAVTSQLHPVTNAGEVWVKDWTQAGLLKPSAVKPVFATLEQNLVIRTLGSFSARDREALRLAVPQILG